MNKNLKRIAHNAVIESGYNAEKIYDTALKFQQLMMIYDGAAKQITTKLEILNKEFNVRGKRSPIESIKSRIKSPESIALKLDRHGLPMSLENMTLSLNDVAGVRVICPYVADIYDVRDMFLSQADIRLIEEKDYIAEPKPSGYRSLHIVVETDVYLSECVCPVRVEVQLRTIAMDFWSSLEHKMRYKTEKDVPQSIRDELRQCADRIAQNDLDMQSIAQRLQLCSV
ncbi:MAG: GTP pyrophosphokinase family protein [Spirochaetota bacterium]|jgi:putative GTP pyrophosphokinase|nr:GTP pyrophosphokinase family protein [Spirochaetota bacterium]